MKTAFRASKSGKSLVAFVTEALTEQALTAQAKQIVAETPVLSGYEVRTSEIGGGYGPQGLIPVKHIVIIARPIDTSADFDTELAKLQD